MLESLDIASPARICRKFQSRTQSPQALWPAVGRKERVSHGAYPLTKKPEYSGYEIEEIRNDNLVPALTLRMKLLNAAEVEKLN